MNTTLSRNELAFQKLLENHTKTDIARAAGITKQGLAKWKGVIPGKYVARISENLGIAKLTLRPEPYADP